MGTPSASNGSFVDALYGQFLQRGINYFLPELSVSLVGQSPAFTNELVYQREENGAYQVDWLGQRYLFTPKERALTPDQKRLLKSIGLVLSNRYAMLQKEETAAQSFRLFRGQPEDRYVSAFLERAPHSTPQVSLESPDRISAVIEVLRVSALSTYENRRIATGVLLFGPLPDSCHDEPPRPPDALPYSTALTAIRSFHRLSDGLQTMALVDRDGLLVELVDVQKWAKPYEHMDLPVPTAARYEAHSRATLCGGHVCLVLTPNGEIKIFSQGAQTFRFLDGRWHLTDAVEKYQRWSAALGNDDLARCLFTVALNLAEERRGGLFLVLEDPERVTDLVAPSDLVNSRLPRPTGLSSETKDQLHYLLRGKRVLAMPPSILETVARIDGAIVLDRDSRVLTFGAILRHPLPEETPAVVEGGRTTAAISASRYGNVLKISEDGQIAFYQAGRQVWEF